MITSVAKQKLDFSSVKSIPIDGSSNVPTCLFYKDGRALIGAKAERAADPEYHKLNRDFKVDLGLHAPERVTQKTQFPCSDGQSRTAGALASDFMFELRKAVDAWLQSNHLVRQPFLLVAEPVAIEAAAVTKEWGENYRDHVRRSLRGKLGFSDIDFCPEPFAVYNYYRYEKKVSFLKERTKQRVLILDFGAGTLDACVIQTTLEGEIAKGGEKAKPLAVSSDAVGGYLYNRLVVEHKFRQLYGKPLGSTIGKGIDLYNRWRKDGDRVLSTAAELYRCFCHHFHQSIYQVEDAKIRLCNENLDWEPDGTSAVPSENVYLPKDPFTGSVEKIQATLTIADLRHVFVENVWPQRIQPMIRKCLDRAKVELEGEPINVVLLSGGSSNLRWLRPLLQRHFSFELMGAPIISLPDYQEVVAKGLAIECAKRFYGRNKDFCQVTYNPLYVFLSCDEAGQQEKIFTPKSSGISKANRPGLLLPAATPVSMVEGGPNESELRWKVRLDREPRRRLDYFFFRSFDERGDVANALNLGSTTLALSGDQRSDSKLQLALVPAGRKSVKPRFYLQSRNDGRQSTFVDGPPFYLDLTTEEHTTRGAYIGFDFGTCNSSLAYVDDRGIEARTASAAEQNWRDIRKLHSVLPYPISEPLARYCSEDDEFRKCEIAREALEGALTVAAFVCYFDYCIRKRRKNGARIRELRQRSAGPLWKMVRELCKTLGNQAVVSKEFQMLLRPEFFERIDRLVTQIAQQKHQKASDVSPERALSMLANICDKVFSRFVMGSFESIRPAPMSRGRSFQGQFKVTHGPPPFAPGYRYTGSQSFSRDEVYLLDTQEGHLLSLWPLMFWHHCVEHPGSTYGAGHLYVFDKWDERSKAYSFKAIGAPCAVSITGIESYAELFQDLDALMAADPDVEIIEPGRFDLIQE
jgi:hypothetical protein